MTAEVTMRGALDMQVCVPEDWSDIDVELFAEQENPSGTSGGWSVRKNGHWALMGAPERARCDTRDGHAHIMVEV